MAAIVALPLWAVEPDSRRILVFALPLTLALVARMRALSWLRNVSIVLTVLIGLAAVPGLETLGFVAAMVLLTGPVVAVAVVGAPLRDVDLPAAGGFLLSGTIAVIAGFASGGVPGSGWLIVGVALAGLAVVAFRLRRRPRPGSW